MVAKVERDGVVAQLADPDPQQNHAGLTGLRQSDVLLEEIDTQLGNEEYCRVTFEVDCAESTPKTLLEAFASFAKKGGQER